MTIRFRTVIVAGLVLLLGASPGRPRLNAEQPPAPSGARGASVTLLPDGTWLTIGGSDDPGRAVIVDPSSGSSREVGRLQVPRSGHTATVLPDGTVLIVGGVDEHGDVASIVERFEIATSRVSAVEDLAITPRAFHTATVLSDGRVLFAGGRAAGGSVRAEVWDPQANVVQPVPGPPRYERQGGTARLRADGRVELSGGTADGAPAEREVFDPTLDAFVYEPPVAGEDHRRIPVVAAVLPGDGATDVALDTRVALRFSEPIDVRSATARTIALLGPEGAARPARLVPAEGGMLAFITAGQPLSPDTEFHVVVSGVRTDTGRPVAGFASRFVTRRALPPSDAAAASTEGASRSPFDSPWRTLAPLQGRPGVTALAGQVLLLDGSPLAHVTIEVGDRRARTDRTGRFLLELGREPSGWEEMIIDGTTANRGGETYGIFEVAVQIVGGTTAALPYTIWMPRIDTAHAVRLASPTRGETVITTPHIPGLELHLPPNTVITDHDGRVVREISLTPIPVDQPPFPLPAGVHVPVYFTVQPGGAYVSTTGSGPKGARLVYPNYHKQPAGAEHNFWHYDPEDRGWYVYGLGRVSADARQVVPNPGVTLYEFTGAMINFGWNPGPDGDNGPPALDPVDLGTGAFIMNKTDLVVADVIPLALTRTYRAGDSGQRPFGLGATHPYAMFLWSAQQYTEADLILPSGRRIHYVRTSAGTGFTDAVFEHTTSPTAFHSSKIVWNGNGWNLTLRDGTVYVFGNEAPLQAIRDRVGNTVTLTWSGTNQFGSGTGNILAVTSPNGRRLTFTYDGLNRITQVADGIGRTAGYQYDASGRLWKVTDARGGVTEYTYDIAHRLLTIKDARGIVYLENEYDTAGRVIEQTQADTGVYTVAYTVNGAGQVTQADVTNPRGYVRRVTFNADRYMTTDVDAVGQPLQATTSYTRLSGSNLVESVTDPLNRVTRVTYDSKGNVTSVTRLYGTAEAVTTSYTYDSTHNQVTSITDPLSHTTTFGYDSQGRIQSATDALSHATTFTTNSAGQVLTVTSALNDTTTFGYDLGDLVSAQTPLGHTTTRFLDAVGRLAQVTDALGSVTRFEYNAHDQITKIIDPRGGETSFSYDGNGNLLTLTDAWGKTTTWTYDNLDRVATRTDPLTRQESFTYDLNGNLATWTDRKGQVTTYQYDALDRQTFVGFGTTGTPPTYASSITTTYDAGDRATQVADSAAGSIGRTYDVLDRLTQETTPEGTVCYTYDDADRRSTMQVVGQTEVSYAYDNADRLTGITPGAAAVTLTYDTADRRTSLTLPNGIVVEYAYDDDARLTGLTYRQGTTTLGTLAYGYDANGQRTSVGGTWARTNLPAALTSATYDHANQIAAFGGVSFTYDANGNLTSDGVRTYTWNARNELASLTGPVNASFGYDGVGRRRAKTVGGTTTQFLYDGLNPVQELSGGSPVANLLTGLGIDEYFARTDAAGVRNYLTDALGSSLALADGSGTVQTEYTYEPFGGTTTSGASTTNAFGFTGREADGTGLFFYRARYYDARLQRFIAEDPLGFSAGDVNLHAYVFNRPTLLTDPTGQFGFGIPLALCAAGAIGSAASDWWGRGKIDPIRAAAWCAIGMAAGFAGGAFASGGFGGAGAAAGAGAGYGGAAAAATAAATAASNTHPDMTRLVEVTFGHGARHLANTGLSAQAVEMAIRAQIQAMAAAGARFAGAFWGMVQIGGTTVTYRAWVLPSGVIHVGTYTVPR